MQSRSNRGGTKFEIDSRYLSAFPPTQSQSMFILGALGSVQTNDLRGPSPITKPARRVSIMQETDVGGA
jgi:hypothetical protein